MSATVERQTNKQISDTDKYDTAAVFVIIKDHGNFTSSEKKKRFRL